MQKIILVVCLIVSGAMLFATSRFIDNGNGTVLDGKTGLIWQKCSKGLSGTDCSIGSVDDDISWEAALTYCESLSLGSSTNWRLPNVNELKSIVDYSKNSPAIDTVSFPGTMISAVYWSSSVSDGSDGDVWTVSFQGGWVSQSFVGVRYNYIRCVSGP